MKTKPVEPFDVEAMKNIALKISPFAGQAVLMCCEEIERLRAACEGSGSIESDAERDGHAFGVKQGHAYPAESQEAYVEGCRAALAVQDYAVAIDGKRMYRRGKEYAPVPSEGIASVAASDEQIDKAARVIAERMDYPWEHMPEKGRDNMRSIARAALAASDESLSRQSSEAAESHRSTRNTQGGI